MRRCCGQSARRAANDGHHPGMDFDPRNPFLRGTALDAGVSAKALRGPGFRLVLPGAYVSATTLVTPLAR